MRAPPHARGRAARADGDQTRAELIVRAGRLFAERGYAATTAKAICEQAGTSAAAINYHFGGRDGLYLAVLREVLQRLVSMAFLRELPQSGLDPEAQLRRFFAELVRHLLTEQSWVMRVWARELITPSPLHDQILSEQTQPRFEALAAIIASITGRSQDDPALIRLVLSTIGPCLMLLIADRDRPTPIRPLFSESPEVLADGLARFAIAGLQADAAARQG